MYKALIKVMFGAQSEVPPAITYTQASHLTNFMGIPTISPNKFRDIDIDKSLGDFRQDQLTEEIKKWRKGEKDSNLKRTC